MATLAKQSTQARDEHDDHEKCRDGREHPPPRQQKDAAQFEHHREGGKQQRTEHAGENEEVFDVW